MTERTTPTGPDHAKTAGSCCASAPAQPAAEVAPAQSSPCCGTSEGAEAAGACCDPKARREAVTADAGCC
ncbi:hypothetical protein [Streptomyces sp. NPDC093094]|uniref:hypothetical protein n=1 Tax=Streptomyces sp. NPDC093094 TaxID=3366026 RepID=UPI00381E4B64